MEKKIKTHYSHTIFFRNPEPISGVYLLLKKDLKTILYVGQSDDIKRRTRQHSQIPWFACEYIEEPNIKKRIDLEHEYIFKYKPLYNILEKRIAIDWKKSHYNWSNRDARWKAEAKIISQYGLLSCRKIQKLLAYIYDFHVNHNTINSDLKSKNYTLYLN